MTSTFDWRNKGPSIFASDPAFMTKAGGKTTSQIASEKVEEMRSKGKMPGTIQGLGNDPDKYHKARENAIAMHPENLLTFRTKRPRTPKETP
jgi:hypothetical protein